MTPVRHVVVFAKAPRMGQVKRRLARGIGPVAALAFYRRSLDQLLRRLGGDSRWRTWIAVTPDQAALAGRPWPAGIPRLPQGGGDLGVRMGRCFRHLPPGPAVIVGSDIPDLRAQHIAGAFRALGAHDAVFGPAPDGGYWLVGLRRTRPTRALFHGVRWSSRHALRDTLAGLGRNRSVAILEELDDIDDADALAVWRRQIQSNDRGTIRMYKILSNSLGQ